ncbi:putative ATP-dependent helicase C23E6.02 [Hordeum vulgare]|nr:putative ATP-dependent helicase C23E6.02 [Hordeum vulgare]
MWSSGRRNGDNPKLQRCVAADATSKSVAKRYTNCDLEPLLSLLHCEMEEYDRRQVLLHHELSFGSPTADMSFAGALSSWTPLTSVKRESEELPPLLVMKREPKAELERHGIIGPEDYLPQMKADAIEGLDGAQKFTANQEECRLIAKQQDEVYIDLVSDKDDDDD